MYLDEKERLYDCLKTALKVVFKKFFYVNRKLYVVFVRSEGIYYSFKYFPRFCVLQTTLNLPYFPHMLKLSGSFCIFSEYT
jgi:hypothetical protein